MNAIDKLKTDLARYQTTLRQLSKDYSFNSAICATVEAALNPPPPAPVTLEELRAAAYKNSGHIAFYGDGSVVWNSFAGKTHCFRHAQDLLDFFNA